MKSMEDFKTPQLFEALQLCQNKVKDKNLKVFISKIIECYGNPESKNADNLELQKVETAEKKDDTKPPDSPKRINKDWPSCEDLKSIAEKTAQNWFDKKIPKTSKEDVLDILMAGNLKFENIDKEKLIELLNRLN
uniref:Uncharacterized protein n=1 Tax=Panagrolaimus sp. PS1159 TaxID=55785 RepID=A0AC35GJ67_9BILA